jgi:hypothetical protein
MELGPLHCLLFNWQKTNPHFPLSATPVILQKPASAEEGCSPEDVANVADLETQEGVEVNFKGLVKVVEVNNLLVMGNTTLGEVGEVLEEDADLDGRITTSLNEIGTHLSTLSRIGSCWKRLISTASLS